MSDIIIPYHADEPGRSFTPLKFIHQVRVRNEPTQLLSQKECDEIFWQTVMRNPNYDDERERWLNYLDGPRVRKYWADINLSRVDYINRPPNGASTGMFDTSVGGKHHQLYIFETGSMVQLPPSYEVTRLVAKDQPKSDRQYPELVLDNVNFTNNLRQLNQGAGLLPEEIFFVWHHLITVEYQAEQPPHQRKSIDSGLKNGNFPPGHMVFAMFEDAKWEAYALILPTVYHTSLPDDPRRDHPYSWFCRAVLCLNYPKIPTRRGVEAAWRAIGEGKALSRANLSDGERKEFIRDWLEPIHSARSDSYWLAIDKYMSHKNLDLAPPPISHLMVGVTRNNTPYPLVLQHGFAPEDGEATKAIKAKTIQPLPVIPLTMTDDDLYPHFCQDLAALQPPGVVINDDDAKGIWNYLTKQRKDRLKKLKHQ